MSLQLLKLKKEKWSQNFDFVAQKWIFGLFLIFESNHLISSLLAILAIFDHKPYDQNYGHDGYPWKDNKKTNSPVKKLSDLDVWVKIYGQK